MKAKTLKALKASIKHWERMRKNPPRLPPGSSSCALCKLFIERGCDGCPVSAFTGRLNCAGSPYGHAAVYAHGTPDWRKAATAEINFLKSLLPK